MMIAMKLPRPRLFSSIISRLVVFSLTVLLVGVVVRYVTLTDYLREELDTLTVAQQTTLAQHLADDIETQVEWSQRWLRSFAATLIRREGTGPQATQAWVQEQIDLFPGWITALHLVALDAPAPSPRLRWDETHGTLLVTVSAPIPDPGPRPMRAIEVTTALHISAPSLTTFWLVLPQDKVVVSMDEAGVVRHWPSAALASLSQQSDGAGTAPNGQAVVFAVAPLRPVDGRVLASVPAETTLNAVVRAQRFILTSGGLIMIGVVLLLPLMLYGFFRPLFTAARQAERMTRDEMPLEPLPVVRDDEVGHLTAAFNRLLLKLRASQAELVRLAHHDALTGLPNRRLVMNHLHEALVQAQRDGRHCGVIYLDLNGFKRINDTLGHDAGDLALVEVARRLDRHKPPEAMLARMGGDEFVVVLRHLSAQVDQARAQAQRALDQIVEAVGLPIILEGRPHGLGVAAGVAIGGESTSAAALISAADAAMYEAKHAPVHTQPSDTPDVPLC